MHIVEFCQFIELRSRHPSCLFNVERDLLNVRVLKGPEPSFYIVVLKLSNTKRAQLFIDEFENRRFNEIEPEVCSVLWLTSIKVENQE